MRKLPLASKSVRYSASKDVELWVGRLATGNTLQDLLEEQGEPGRWWPKPNFFFYTTDLGNTPSDSGEVFTKFLASQGEHLVYVGIYLPNLKNLWFCDPPFTVTEDSS